MKKRIEITFGLGKTGNGRKIGRRNAQNALRRIESRAVALFGGETLRTGHGAWRSPSGKLVTEPSASLVIYASAGKGTTTKAHKLASFAKAELEQDSVALAITPATIEFI